MIKAVQAATNPHGASKPVKAAEVQASGPPTNNAMALGTAPKAKDKIFSAIVTEPEQVKGAMDNL